ncbi:ATP-binding protein [Desulfopila aestuarii]|uniref:endopeptidase La n=1 Tax=Desulfopila aestuarii DSM 18488 TaxID=1121416 RepID=A0A1M7Y441_9BACT|nr:ATP-binding protein [Desulfopila aestuarii]SHO46969.1 lon-related putative ATP-dependent protease [Desulfopila aestuarii DSM 18488]
MAILSIDPDKACVKCPAELFEFTTTDDIHDIVQIAGQDRALEAVEFGIGIEHKGFNLFVIGPQGTGRHTVIRSFIDQKALESKPPSDWCYVNNFKQPHKPSAFEFPQGKAFVFRKEMKDLVELLRVTLSTVFEGEDFKARLRAINEDFKRRVDKIYREIEERAKRESIAVVKSDQGIMVAPMDGAGNILDTEGFLKLPQVTRQRIDELIEKYQNELQEGMQKIAVARRDVEAMKRRLKDDLARQAVASLITALKKKYDSRPELMAYLEDVENDIVEHADDFLQRAPENGKENFLSMMTAHTPSFERYEVNILVSNGSDSAPVVYEDLPNFQNLHGRIENLARMGMLTTHFTLIKPGSLHMANGGYIIIDARRLLTQPYSYEGLKRTLRAQQIRIEPLERLLGLMNTVTLEPEPIPLRAKVVLIGDAYLYYLLKYYDPEFDSLFKVQVDFEHSMDRTPENLKVYVSLITGMIKSENLLPMDKGGVARLVEHSARMAGDGEKISLYLEQVATIVKEADHIARKAGDTLVTAACVQQALDAAKRRESRIRDRMFEVILQGIRKIATEGSEVGQVNGLSVLGLGSTYFGLPTRITALTRPGKEGELIDIEKKVDLGGPIHSKGVLILESFLRARYLRNMPIGLRASLVFEQSYGGVDGDSASVAELCVLLSSLSGLPIKQHLAITGAISQRGEAQAIGGVNEKIEGFFDLCNSRGLNGLQGVIIPEANVRHLMLKDEVVEAMRKKQFSIWSVTSVDEAVELLTGVPAGVRGEDGAYPADTVNGKVEAALKQYMLDIKAFEKTKKDKGEHQESKKKDDNQ